MEKACIACNKSFAKPPTSSVRAWALRKFCSSKCSFHFLPHPTAGKHYPNKQGKNHPNWRGRNVGYFALHKWVERWLGLAKHGICASCGRKEGLQWANKSNTYKRNVRDWQILCGSCHRKYDIKMNGTIPWNKGLKGAQVAWNKGVRGEDSHSFGNTHGFKKGAIPHNKNGRTITCKSCKGNLWVAPSRVNKRYCSKSCWYKRSEF